MRIEPADTDSAAEIADLWMELAAGQRDYGSHILPNTNRNRVRESLVRHAVTDSLLVAREDDRILGFVSFHPESGTFEQDVKRGIIENIYVIPDRRGEGIGSELLAAAEKQLFRAGCDVVGLEVMAANERAREFYRQHGYAPHRVEMERTDSDKTDHE